MKLNYNAFVRMEFMDDFHLDHEVFEIQIVKDIGIITTLRTYLDVSRTHLLTLTFAMLGV